MKNKHEIIIQFALKNFSTPSTWFLEEAVEFLNISPRNEKAQRRINIEHLEVEKHAIDVEIAETSYTWKRATPNSGRDLNLHHKSFILFLINFFWIFINCNSLLIRLTWVSLHSCTIPSLCHLHSCNLNMFTFESRARSKRFISYGYVVRAVLNKFLLLNLHFLWCWWWCNKNCSFICLCSVRRIFE